MPGSFTGQGDIIDGVINIVGYISLAVINLCLCSHSKCSGLDKILRESLSVKMARAGVVTATDDG